MLNSIFINELSLLLLKPYLDTFDATYKIFISEKIPIIEFIFQFVKKTASLFVH